MNHLQEAELRKTQRLESIRRANELLYEQTDKMKMLRGQMLYSDVIVTREQQIEEKRKVWVKRNRLISPFFLTFNVYLGENGYQKR